MRGWNDPSWKAPEAAVYAAAKRLTDNDPNVERVSRRHWRMRAEDEVAITDNVVVEKNGVTIDQSRDDQQEVALAQ